MKIRSAWIIYLFLLLGPLILRAQSWYDTDTITRNLGLAVGNQDFLIRNRSLKVNIGDKVPEYVSKVFHYPTSTLKPSDFKGKLVILDFWSEWCEGCVRALPRMTALQKEFGDKVMILPVTFQSFLSTKTFYEKRAKIGKAIGLPSVVEDSILHACFAHHGEPFEAWIGTDGRVIALTGGEYVTNENIQAVLDGRPIRFPDCSFTAGATPASDSTVISGSYIAEMRSFSDNPTFLRPTQGLRTIIINNRGIVDLFAIAYNKAGGAKIKDIPEQENSYQTHKRILTNFNKFAYLDSTYFIHSYTPKNSIDRMEYKYYCYEQITPASITEEAMYKKMIRDLEQTLHIQSSIQKRTTKVLYLVKRTGYKNHPPTNEPDCIYNEDKEGYWRNNGFISEYLREMNFSDINLPIIYDKTFIRTKIHLPIQLGRNITLADLQRQLQANQLDLISGTKEMYLLILNKE